MDPRSTDDGQTPGTAAEPPAGSIVVQVVQATRKIQDEIAQDAARTTSPAKMANSRCAPTRRRPRSAASARRGRGLRYEDRQEELHADG